MLTATLRCEKAPGREHVVLESANDEQKIQSDSQNVATLCNGHHDAKKGFMKMGFKGVR